VLHTFHGSSILSRATNFMQTKVKVKLPSGTIRDFVVEGSDIKGAVRKFLPNAQILEETLIDCGPTKTRDERSFKDS